MSANDYQPEFILARVSQIPYYKNTSLYYLAENNEFVLYKQPGDIIIEERLESEAIPRLFIRDHERLAAALEAQEAFNHMLDDSIKKGDVNTIHKSLTGITEETLSEPRSGTMRHARRSVALLTRASVRDPKILQQLASLSIIDYTTALHSVNVMALTLGFAHQVGFGWRRTLEFGLAALLHDIGKLGIPEELLKSPRKLTEEEFRTIKKHPMNAIALLERSGMNLPKIRDAATEHHEKMDGSGYPMGKTDISLVGQIVGLIDAYEALTNEDRPYRRALTPAKAIEVLNEDAERGRYLPSVFERFVQSLSL